MKNILKFEYESFIRCKKNIIIFAVVPIGILGILVIHYYGKISRKEVCGEQVSYIYLLNLQYDEKEESQLIPQVILKKRKENSLEELMKHVTLSQKDIVVQKEGKNNIIIYYFSSNDRSEGVLLITKNLLLKEIERAHYKAESNYVKGMVWSIQEQNVNSCEDVFYLQMIKNSLIIYACYCLLSLWYFSYKGFYKCIQQRDNISLISIPSIRKKWVASKKIYLGCFSLIYVSLGIVGAYFSISFLIYLGNSTYDSQATSILTNKEWIYLSIIFLWMTWTVLKWYINLSILFESRKYLIRIGALWGGYIWLSILCAQNRVMLVCFWEYAVPVYNILVLFNKALYAQITIRDVIIVVGYYTMLNILATVFYQELVE